MTKNTNKTPSATGSCQICERTCKMPGGVTSLHGYKRPGCGWINGSCFGAYSQSYETSCARLVEYVAIILAPHRARLVETLATLNDATMTEITVVTKAGPVTYVKGVYTPTQWGGTEQLFESVRSRQVRDAEYGLRQVDREIDRCDKRIANWK